MGEDTAFDIAHTVLLAMDCQAGIVPVYATPPEEFVERASSVLRGSTKAGMQVVHVQVGFRPKFSGSEQSEQALAALKSSSQHQKLFQGAPGAIHPTLGPEPDDIIVTKHRVNVHDVPFKSKTSPPVG
jgi:nicotinamidase-related amidase